MEEESLNVNRMKIHTVIVLAFVTASILLVQSCELSHARKDAREWKQKANDTAVQWGRAADGWRDALAQSHAFYFKAMDSCLTEKMALERKLEAMDEVRLPWRTSTVITNTLPYVEITNVLITNRNWMIER